MKKFLMALFSALFVLSVSGCGSSDSDDNNSTKAIQKDPSKGAEAESAAENSGVNSEKSYIKEAKFDSGKYGAIVLTSNISDVKDMLKGAHLIDIRTQWERDNLGYPVEFKESVVYQKRHYYFDNDGKKHHDGTNEDGSVDGTVNENFMSEVATLVGSDKDVKIVLICDSGSRTGAYYDGEDSDVPSKKSAAKDLSEEGYTNVYHVYGGYKKWKENNLPTVPKK